MSVRVGTLAVFAAVVLSGCATIEFSDTPEFPRVEKISTADAVEHASPPALPDQPDASTPPALAQNPEPLNLTVEGAILLALEHNLALLVEEVNPAIQQTFVSEQRSVFDPVLLADYSVIKDELDRDLLIQTPFTLPDFSGQGNAQTINIWRPIKTEVKTESEGGNVRVTEFLPTGTNIDVSVGRNDSRLRNRSSNPDLVYGTDTDDDGSNLNLTVTQSLLRGFGLGVNLASLRQAKIDRLRSDYEFRAFVEDLVSQVEQTYWNCMLAQRQIRIFEESLVIAERQAAEVEENIRIGKLAEVERAAAVSEVAQRRSSLIDARSNYDTVRLALLRLINPFNDSLTPTTLVLKTDPLMPDIDLDTLEWSIDLAQKMRPELNQARLLIERDELEIVRTRNGLLPQLDVFLSISESVNDTNYPEWYLTSSQNRETDRYTTEIGAQFSYPIGNRAPRARNTRSKLARTRDERALTNLAQLVEQDVRNAYIELGRSREQIAATEATRVLQEETLNSEQEKFRLGRSTVLLVAQAQRDLLTAQINEVQAVSEYLNAIVNLYRVEGSLLERRGIDAPGREPVQLDIDVAARRAPVAVETAATADQGDKQP